MDVICHADTYRVDFPVGQKFLIGIKRFSPIPDCQLLGTFLIQIEKSGQPGIRILRIFRDVPDLRNLSAADNAYIKHDNSP